MWPNPQETHRKSRNEVRFYYSAEYLVEFERGTLPILNVAP